MTVKKIEKLFNNESGEKTIILHEAPNQVNACSSIGIEVESGSVLVNGKMSKDSEATAIGMIDLYNADVVGIASVGAFSVLGAETLYSVTIVAEENTTATIKLIY